MKRNLVILLILIKSGLVHSQHIITGTVTNRNSKETLPFVNIGIKNKNIGTASQLNGSFSMNLPAQYENDTLTFSIVGCEPLRVFIKYILNNDIHEFKLIPKSIKLEDVVISAGKLSEKKIGIVKYNPVFHFIDASQNREDIYEIGQLVHLGKKKIKISSINLFINETTNDSATFRINFYSYHDEMPQAKLVEKSIVQTHYIVEGWLRFDLSAYNINLNEDVIAAIEFLPPDKKQKAIQYDVKLGGRTKSFVRRSSQGAWQTPPHHYRLFITALTDDIDRKKEDHEEDETPPTKKFYSNSVHDTFSIFVSLPKNYNTSLKKYPVVYLLDANVYFDAIKGFLLLSKSAKDVILVGIGYKDAFIGDSLRNRDYTYPGIIKSDSMPVSGGGNNFIEFIRKELIPDIDKNYSTDTKNRSLMGHSLGGFFVLHLLKSELNSSFPLFSYFVSVSPSLEYADKYLFKQFMAPPSGINKRLNLYLTTGGNEDVKLFDDFIGILSSQNINVKHEVLLKLDHMEAAIPGFKRGLKLFDINP